MTHSTHPARESSGEVLESTSERETTDNAAVPPSNPYSEFLGAKLPDAEALQTLAVPGKSFSGDSIFVNVLIPLTLLAAGAGVVAALGSVAPKARPAADTTRAGQLRALPAVNVDRVRSLEDAGAQLRLQVDGVVVPYREVQLATEVAGQVIYKSPKCEAGSFVNQGEVLMRIDPADYELEVERLTRSQEQEYQALRELDQELVNTKRLVELADKDLALQEKELARRRAMPAGFASQVEIDQASRAVLAAQQARLGYENQLDLLAKRRIRLEASERLAATQLKVAELNLERTEITSPIDGVIVSENAELNTFVARGAAVVTMEDTSKVEVATRLRMDQLHWVLDQPQDTITDDQQGYSLPETPAVIEYEVTGRSGLVYKWNGRLLSYDGIGVDQQTRTVPVRVIVDDPKHYVNAEGEEATSAGPTALVRGMYVRVQLLIKPKTPLVVIPARALKPGNRVWQFVPDESVLVSSALKTVPAEQASSPPQSTNKAVPSDPAAVTEANEFGIKDDFNPVAWMPGRVVVRSNIIPVDSLQVVTADDRPADEFTSPLEGGRRQWVCEVRDGSVVPDSLVVTSPLGSVDDQSVPARAPASVDPMKTPSQVTTAAADATGEAK